MVASSLPMMPSPAPSPSSSVRLSDQVGAIAVIDEMRHRHMVVQDHLAIDDRRLEVAQRIRAFYDAQGAQVSDEMVEQGVRRFFDQRLVHEPVTLSRLAQAVANAHMDRKVWARRGLVALSVACAAAGTAVFVSGMSQRAAEKEMAAFQEASAQLAGQLRQRESELAALELRLKSTPSDLAQQNLVSGRQAIGSAQSLMKSVNTDPDVPTLGDRDATARDAVAMKAAASQAGVKAALAAATFSLHLAERYLNVTEKHVRLLAMPATTLALKDLTVRALASSAQAALDAGDPKDVVPVEQAVAKFETGVASFGAINALRESAQANRQRLAALPLDPAERALADAPLAALDQALKSLDAPAARAALNQTSALLDLADLSLKAEIVSRANMKTGIERTFTAPGGTSAKAWYVLVEMVDPAGKAHAVDVKSSETGQTKNVTVFGVRISKDEFDRIRADKLADGLVNDKLMGNKPRGRLLVQYGGRAMEPLASITEY